MRRRTVVAASILFLLVAGIGLSTEDRATVVEGRTGLLWVADPEFAVSSGFSPNVVMPRAKALRMVAAMNRGALPNFGRKDWRLPTQRELKAWLRSQGLSTRIAPTPGVDVVRAWPVVGAATLPGVSATAILATNSAQINRDGHVTGDVVVNDASAGPYLDASAQLKLDRNNAVTGNVKSNSIKVDQQTVVTGNASYNTLTNNGTITGSLSHPLALPVFALLPVFHTAAPRPGASDVSVGAGQTVTLPAGDYGHVSVAATGKLVLSGGIYNVTDVTTVGGCTYPCASIEATGATDVRMAQRLALGINTFFGPQSGSGVDASQIVVYVGGINGTTGVLGATPSAAAIGRGAHVGANVYARDGSVIGERDVVASGSFIGRDVRLGQNTTLQVASYFSNHPPVAIPANAFTHGAGTITITLRGSDVDLDDLTFSIVSGSGPTQGTLGPVVELPPPVPPGDPERPQGDPPRTEATVDYTPNTAGNVEDSFVFRVTDTSGASGTAVVRINPPDSEEEAPAPTTVVANDADEATNTDQPVTVGLTAGAPAGVSVTFSILPATGPANGELGTLVQGTETPQRSASVEYTPDSGFVGVDSFQFQACGVIASVTVCDSGTATIEVTAVGTVELAPDQSVSTPVNTAVTIGLGSSGGTSTLFAPSASIPGGGVTTRRINGKAAFLQPAAVAGNVADADDNGFGDNHNDLASGAPVFVYAAVGSTGGAGSNGTVRIQIEWDISSLGPIGAGSTADVTLTTNRGATDALDTYFFAGADTGGNGTLEDSDFESNLEQVPGAVMPVTGALGADGTFTFDVKDALNDAIASGADFFIVQARVDENLSTGRGLGVYSTADNPLNAGKVPALILTSPPPTPPATYTILTLPVDGQLKDSGNTIITAVPYELPDGFVTYTPNTGFTGSNHFDYRAELGVTVDTGRVTLFINNLNCATDPAGCFNGR